MEGVERKRKEGKEQGMGRVLGRKGNLKGAGRRREEECQDEETGGRKKEATKDRG